LPKEKMVEEMLNQQTMCGGVTETLTQLLEDNKFLKVKTRTNFLKTMTTNLHSQTTAFSFKQQQKKQTRESNLPLHLKLRTYRRQEAQMQKE
jgi:hypothetical protein